MSQPQDSGSMCSNIDVQDRKKKKFAHSWFLSFFSSPPFLASLSLPFEEARRRHKERGVGAKGTWNLKHPRFGDILLERKQLNMSAIFCPLLCFSPLLYFMISARWAYGGNAFWSAGEFFIAIPRVATGQLWKEGWAVLSYPGLDDTFMIWRENWFVKWIMWSPTVHGFLCSLSHTACLDAPLSATWVTW